MLCVSNIEVSSSNATERTYTIFASHTLKVTFVFSLLVSRCVQYVVCI